MHPTQANNTWVNNECICCSTDTIQQDKKRLKVAAKNIKLGHDQLASCKNCGNRICLSCALSLSTFITDHPLIPNQVKSQDVSVQCLNETLSAFQSAGTDCVTDFGICCSFKASSGRPLQPVTVPPPRPPVLVDKINCAFVKSEIEEDCKEEYETDGGEVDEFLPSTKEANRMLRQSINKLTYDKTSSNFLYDYHSDKGKWLYEQNLKPSKPKTVLKSVAKRYKSPGQQIKTNVFQGALHMPTYGLTMQADASNMYWYADHLALALSKVDGTPHVRHGVFNKKSADDAHAHATKQNIVPSRIVGVRETIVLKDVPSPQDKKITRNMTVEVITVDQIYSTQESSHLKGDVQFDPEYIVHQKMFGNEDMNPNVDATIILGNFIKEDGDLPPKLLLLRFNSMLSNTSAGLQDKNSTAEKNIQHTPLPLWKKRV